MGSTASNSVAVLPATSRDDSRHVLDGGLFRHLTDHWLRHCAKKVERNIRGCGHGGLLADFTRASRG
jgi:hypothetical protein